MRAWLLDELSGLAALRVAEAPDPVAAPGEALIEVHLAGLNPADRYLAERQYPARPKLPHILGRDAVGRVVGLGEGAAGVRLGQVVAILRGDMGVNRPGTFAERVAAPLENLVEIPPDWSEAEAAGASLVYLTAHQALTMWGRLPEAAVVLVTGASGGVGIAAVQLAAAMGLTVAALSRSAEKRDRLRDLGAAETVDPADPHWRLALKSALGGRRVDLAIDSVGGRLLPEVIDALGELGKVSLVGRLAGPVPEFNTASLFFRRLRMGGVAVGALSNAESRAAWQEVLALLALRKARPVVDSRFPFEQLPQAFARLAQGPLGKVLLEVKISA